MNGRPFGPSRAPKMMVVCMLSPGDSAHRRGRDLFSPQVSTTRQAVGAEYAYENSSRAGKRANPGKGAMHSNEQQQYCYELADETRLM